MGWRAGKESDSKNLDRNLQVARQLARHAEPVIKACAATLMWGLNKRGKVSERKLQKILACIGPHALKYKLIRQYLPASLTCRYSPCPSVCLSPAVDPVGLTFFANVSVSAIAAPFVGICFVGMCRYR